MMATYVSYITGAGNIFNLTENSSYPLSNIIGVDENNTTPTRYNVATGSGVKSMVNLRFDLSGLPRAAVISSATVKVRARINSTANTTARLLSYWVEEEFIGTTQSLTTTTTTYSRSISVDKLNRDYECGIQFSVTRGTRNTFSAVYVEIYGASITIEYEVEGHSLTIYNEDNADISPTTSDTYISGETVDFCMYETPLPLVILDGVDITSQFSLKDRETSWEGTAVSASNTGITVNLTQYSLACGYTAEDPYTETSLNWYGTSSAAVDSQYIAYAFNLASIPEDAEDIEVHCKVAGTAESSTYSHTAGGRYSIWQLADGSGTKGSQVYTTSQSIEVLELTDTGNWTREELNHLKLRHYVGYYGGSTVGITLTITYSLPKASAAYTYTITMDLDHVIIVKKDTDVVYVKKNNEWVKALVSYKKENGVWVQILNSDVLDIFKQQLWLQG